MWTLSEVKAAIHIDGSFDDGPLTVHMKAAESVIMDYVGFDWTATRLCRQIANGWESLPALAMRWSKVYTSGAYLMEGTIPFLPCSKANAGW